jgi:DNA (cytosine-5)-methyltransferase 1
MGYHRAGFSEIVVIDIVPQKRYPFNFILGDALEFCVKWGHEFDIIVGSPPCQSYSRLHALAKGKYPRLIGKTRLVMKATGRPYVIENVATAWRSMENPIMLCGTMFPGLRVQRHRLFECSPVVWFPPATCYHWGRCGNQRLLNGEGKRVTQSFENCDFLSISGNGYIAADGRKAMGIDWMTIAELSQAIPPAYTEWLGREMLRLI